MKKRLFGITAIMLILCLMAGLTGCRKSGPQVSGEWLSERTYYYYDADGNWVEVTDDSFLNDPSGNETTENEESNDTTVKPVVDSSDYQVLVDYCGNDDFKKVFDKKNITKETLHADVLEDDWRFRKLEQKDGDAYVTYKVDGIAEFFVEYSYGSGARTANEIAV